MYMHTLYVRMYILIIHTYIIRHIHDLKRPAISKGDLIFLVFGRLGVSIKPPN